MENWKEIEGFIGYEISDLGRVKSLKRKKWNGFAFQDIQEKMLALKIKPDGYVCVTLCNNGKCSVKSLHRLVALHFVDNPNNLPIVSHLDHNPQNCCASNLKWDTQLGNIQLSVKDGRFTRGEKVKNSKFTTTEVIEIRRKIENKEISQCKLAKELGVTQNCISEIVNRQTWRHI